MRSTWDRVTSHEFDDDAGMHICKCLSLDVRVFLCTCVYVCSVCLCVIVSGMCLCVCERVCCCLYHLPFARTSSIVLMIKHMCIQFIHFDAHNSAYLYAIIHVFKHICIPAYAYMYAWISCMQYTAYLCHIHEISAAFLLVGKWHGCRRSDKAPYMRAQAPSL